MTNEKPENTLSSSSTTSRRSCWRTLFNIFSVSLFSLLFFLVGMFTYQHFDGRRLAFHAHKAEAHALYAVIAPWYDTVINPWHWTSPMLKRVYDNSLIPSWGRWNKTTSTATNSRFSEKNKMKVLDIGAGTGFNTIGIIEATDARTTEITMLDQSDHQLAEAAKKPILNNTKKILGDSHKLPFDNESYHVSTNSGSIEYWPRPGEVFKEIFRVLKPGGYSVTIGPARPTHWLAKCLADSWYLFPQKSEYILWMEAAGFDQIEVMEVDPEWYGPTDRQYGLIMGYIVYAKKSETGKPRKYEYTYKEKEFLNSETHEGSPTTDSDYDTISTFEKLYRFGRFTLGTFGALYYTFLPLFIALKTTGFGVGENYPDLIQPPKYFPAVGSLADYAFGLIVAELIWIFVSLHLQAPKNANKQNNGQNGGITLRSIYNLARPHTIKATALASVLGYLLAATFTLNYTEHLVEGLHILVSGLAVNVYIVALNQLTDIEIDIENEKPLPIVTGELSWNNAKFITHISFIIASALALGGVNATWWIFGVMLLALIGTLYSIEPYRFKQWSSTAAASIALARGIVAICSGVATLIEVFKVDSEDLVNFPVWPMCLTFAGILLIFCLVIAIAKDVPDVHGDKKANINTLAIRFGSANLMKVSYFTLMALYTGIIGAFLNNQPYQIDVLSLVGFHLVAAIFLTKTFLSSWPRLEDKNVCIDLYINVIWNLFYFELISFPVPCLVETLRYRHVISPASSTASMNQTSLAVFIAVMAPLVLVAFVKEQVAKFLTVADKIHQVKSIKNTICQHVLNDEELKGKNCPALFNDQEKIFSDKKIKEETDSILLRCNNNNSNSSTSAVKNQVELDSKAVRENITNLIGLEELAIFHQAANHVFKNPGKMIRSRIITLLARTMYPNNNNNNNKIIDNALTLAVCTEMSHSASLLHDDVVDESDTRRGAPSTSKTFGNKLAILSGDYLFSRALRHLTLHVRNEEVTANVAQVLENLTKGEVVQMSPNGNDHSKILKSLLRNDNDDSDDEKEKQKQNKAFEPIIEEILERYWIKTYLKTASLFALTCKSVACLSSGSSSSNGNSNNNNDDQKFYAEAFGRAFGMAFQLIDDLIDYDEDQSTQQALGKPTGQDLKLGLATLPVILAAKKHPRALLPLILRNFSREGDVEKAMSFVTANKSTKQEYFKESQKYVDLHIRKAIGCLMHFPKSEWRNELVELVSKYKLY